MQRYPLILCAVALFAAGMLVDDVYDMSAAQAEQAELARRLPRPGPRPPAPIVEAYRRILPDHLGKARNAWMVTHRDIAVVLISSAQGLEIQTCYRPEGVSWAQMSTCPSMVHRQRSASVMPSAPVRVDGRPQEPPAEYLLRGHSIAISKQICQPDRGCTLWTFEIDGLPLLIPRT